MTSSNHSYSAGSVQARLLRTLVDEALRALLEISPAHWLFIASGGHWAVWMRSAAEPEFVIEFTVGTASCPHEADTEEPEFIGYLNAPHTAVAARLLGTLRSLGDIVSAFGGGHVDWTLVDAFDGAHARCR